MMCGHTNMRRTFAGDVTLLDRDSRLPSFDTKHHSLATIVTGKLSARRQFYNELFIDPTKLIFIVTIFTTHSQCSNTAHKPRIKVVLPNVNLKAGERQPRNFTILINLYQQTRWCTAVILNYGATFARHFKLIAARFKNKMFKTRSHATDQMLKWMAKCNSITVYSIL